MKASNVASLLVVMGGVALTPNVYAQTTYACLASTRTTVGRSEAG